VAAALPPSGTVWTDRGLRTVLRRLLRRRRTIAAPPGGDPGDAPLADEPDGGPPPTLGGAALTLPTPTPLAAPASPVASAPSVAALCPSCHVPYLPAGVAGRMSCPLCGRHAAAPGALSRSGATAPGARAAPAANPREELLARWMLGQAVPCPHCKSPLRQFSSTVLICHACGRRLEVPELAGPTLRAARSAPEGSVADRVHHPVHVGGEGSVGAERSHPGP
jgi:uncharacterized Zn finger protein (UPF0148 family)